MSTINIDQERRDAFLSAEENNCYLHIGYFICWYAAVELRLTFLLSRILDANDWENFELLAMGMDGKIKCERLRTGCRINGYSFGTNLDDRLHYFYDRIISTRNSISHSWPTQHPGSPKLVHFATLSRVPGQVRGFRAGGPKSIAIDELFLQGLWLYYFSEDLVLFGDVTPLPKTLEIASPQSTLPPEFLERQRLRRERANADTQPQKPTPDLPGSA